MRRASVLFLFAAVTFLAFPGCGNIKEPNFPYVASPLVIVHTPVNPAEGNITITFQLTDREVEPADVTVEYSTNGGTTYSTATLTIPGDATNLASAWHPGKTHSVTWNSVTDMVGRSGAVSVCVKITPSDASNPSGTPGISGSFTVNNIAYNEAPTATAATPAGVQTGNVQLNYFLADVESDTCSIAVLYSTNGGTSYQAATMGPAGDGVSGLSSSPSGTAHVYLWDSRADNVAPSGQVDTIRIRITPTDFNTGTAGDTNSFSVDNSVANDPPTVAITGGPADGSTVTTTQVTFTWSGNDTDGSVVGYYYSFDHDPPDVWTTDTTVTSGALSEAAHIFRVVAVDDDSDLSAVASRTFTVSAPGTIYADFTASPTSGTTPLVVNFTDLSTSTNGIDTWWWDFGDMSVSDQRNPQHTYSGSGTFTVSLTVTGPDGTDSETKAGYISVMGDPLAISYGWTRRIGGSSYEIIYSVCADSAGNVYAGGNFALTVDFAEDWGGADERTAPGLEDMFIMKVDPAGSYSWTRVISGTGHDSLNSICTDTSDNVYLYGEFQGTANFAADWGGDDTKSIPSHWDAFVTKIDAAGDYGWTYTLGGVDSENGLAMCIDADGNIYLTGIFEATGEFAGDWGATDEKTSAGGKDIFVMKINSDETYGWTHRIGGENYDYSRGICTDSSGNVYVVGYFSGTVNFADDWGGTDEKTVAGLSDIFITKLDADGNYQWTRRMGGPSTDRPTAIRASTDGSVYVCGNFYGTVDFAEDWGSTDSKAGLWEDGFITKIDATGAYCWTRIITARSSQGAEGMHLDEAGNIFLTGYFYRGTPVEPVNFAGDWGGTDEKTSVGEEDVFVMKIAADGSYCWAHRMGSLLADLGRAVCTDPSGNIYIVGDYESTAPNFGEDWGEFDVKTNAGNQDIFITKLEQP